MCADWQFRLSFFNHWDDNLTLSYQQQGTKYDYIYRHHLRQYPELIHLYPRVYDIGTTENYHFIFPMILTSVLLGDSEDHIPSQVLDISHSLSSFDSLKGLGYKSWDTPVYPHMSRLAAHRCINSLIHDPHSNSAAFALDFLSLILYVSSASADLNNACHLLCSALDYSSTGRPLAYDCMGRPYAQRGHTIEETYQMTEKLEHDARRAMQNYMERYAKGTISHTVGESFDED